eukprot:3604533-Pyramimonas_sp.AAC.1
MECDIGIGGGRRRNGGRETTTRQATCYNVPVWLLRQEESINLTKNPTICSYGHSRCMRRIRWSSLWGYKTCDWCATMGALGTC